MSLQRSFTMGLVVFAAFAISSSTQRAFARGSDGGRAAKVTSADEAQMRELLSRLSAASGAPAEEERTDADLMYEAMIRWNGEPPGSAAIDRLLEQSKKEAVRTKRATVEKVRAMFWKDPFSDHPHKMIPVRQEDRELLAAYDRKGRRSGDGRSARESELSRLRAEVEAARADAAAARAENARLRARAETSSDSRDCVADSSRSEVRLRRRISGSGRSHRHETRQSLALASTVQSDQRQTSAAPPPATEPVVPATVAPLPQGMIITPLPITTSSSPSSTGESGRQSRSSRR